MAIKDLIGAGIGFSPGSVKFIVTRGLSIAATANLGPLSEDLSLLFTTKRRETASQTAERTILSTSKRREAKP